MDVLIFLEFKIRSNRALLFRKWANGVLKQYLLQGYVINEERTLLTNETM